MTHIGQHAEARLPEVLDTLGTAVFVCDSQGPECPVVCASRGLSVLTRYSQELLEGRDLADLLAAGTAPGLPESLREAIRNGESFCGDVFCPREEGEGIWCELRLAPTEWEGTFDRYWCGTLVEITERRERELRLAESEARCRGMFENSVEGIYQSTPEGRYLAVNPALARMYGYSSPDDLMKRVSDIQSQIYVDPSLRERFRREIERCGVVRDLEYEVRRRDGNRLWISERARAVRDDAGTVRYYEGFVSDISARKEAEAVRAQLEKQMIQAHKMEAVGVMAGGIAHDFNNMLCVMLGHTELTLADTHITGFPRKNLEAVLKAANRAKDLVRQILAFSRKTEAERAPIKLGPILKESVKMLKAALPSSVQVQLALETDHDVVVADPTEIHQVMMNLGNNAAHAMRRHGGELGYSLSALELDAAGAAPLALKPGRYVCLAVRDTGHGMSPEIIEQIFDPFFTTKPAGEGTGLGLALVREIVTRYGGHVAVESTVGLGTTFRIYLPQTARAPRRLPGQEATECRGHQERLLVVDDEVGILDMMQQRLRLMGYRVVTRADSLAALDAVRTEPERYAAVITDQTMPDLLGTELAEKLGEIRPNLPVVLMTGLNQPPGFANSRFGGRRAVVQKPIDFADLSRRLRGFIDDGVFRTKA